MKNIKIITVGLLFVVLTAGISGCTTQKSSSIDATTLTPSSTIPTTASVSDTPTPTPENQSSTTLMPTTITPTPIEVSGESQPLTILDKTYSVHLEDIYIIDLVDALKDNPIEKNTPYEFNIGFPPNIKPIMETSGWEVWPNINVLLISSINDKNKIGGVPPTFNYALQTWDYSGVNLDLQWDDVIFGKKVITFREDIPKFLVLDARKGFFRGNGLSGRVFPVNVKIIKNPINVSLPNNEKILFEDSFGVHHGGYYVIDLGEEIGFLEPSNKYKLYATSPWAGQTVVLLNCNVLVVDTTDKPRFSSYKPMYNIATKKWDYSSIAPIVQIDDITQNEEEFSVDSLGNYYIVIDNRVYPGNYNPEGALVFPVNIRLTQVT